MQVVQRDIAVRYQTLPFSEHDQNFEAQILCKVAINPMNALADLTAPTAGLLNVIFWYN